MASNFFVHKTSIVDPSAELGDGSKIWHFCHISSAARVGNDTSIGQNCFVGPEVLIGSNVKIQNNVSVFSGVTIQDDVFVGPSVVFTNVKRPRSFINQKKKFSQTTVLRGATIGANVTIVCGIKIGAFAMIGAGSVVSRDVGDYELVVGNPAKLIGYVSRSGERLNFNENGLAVLNSEKYELFNGTVTMSMA